MRHVFFGIVAVALSSANIVAEESKNEPKQIGKFGEWSVYYVQGNEAQESIYYLSAKPQKSEGKCERGDVHALITLNLNKEGGTVNFVSGYKFPDRSAVFVHLADQKFTLFTKDDGAWAIDNNADKTLILAMLAAQQMVVKGESDKGVATTDIYSLKGFADAYQAALKARVQVLR